MQISLVRILLLLTLFPVLSAFAIGQVKDKPVRSEEEAANSIVHLEAVSAVSFSTILKALSAQTHLAFVAEGVPLKAQTSEESVQVLCAADEPLRAKMGKVGNAFDYDVEYKPGVCLMRKRYSNPDDLPTVTYEECVYFAKEAERAVQPYQKTHEERVFSDPLLPFFKASTSEEIKLFKGEGIPVSRMNEAQRDATLRLVYNGGMQIYPFEALPMMLHEIASRSANFVYKDIKEICPEARTELPVLTKTELPVLCFLTPVTTADVFGFLPLSHMELIRTSWTPPRSSVEDSKFRPATDPSNWTLQDAADAEARFTISGATTVGQLVALLNRDIPQITYRVDTGLDRKRITIIGETKSNAQSIIRAAVDLYNLTIMPEADKSSLITFKPMMKIHRISDLTASLAKIYPDSLTRYFSNIQHQQLKVVAKAVPLLAEASPDGAAFWAKERADEVARKPLCKRVRMLVEPSLDQATHRRLSLADMQPQKAAEARDLIGMMHMIGVYQTYEKTLQYAQWEPLVHFENVVLQGTYDAKPDGSINETYRINLRKPSGELLNYSRSGISIPSLADREAGAELLRQSGAVSPQ